jgi:MSHA pilin protein MshC
MRGFTTVELVVVMVVMGLLAAVAVPRLTSRTVLQERGVQDQLRGLLRSSRQLAVTQGRDVCVLLTPDRARAVYTAAGACASAMPVAGTGGEAELALTLPPGVVLGGAPLVRFNARGQLVPAADRTVTVGSLALTVSRETGHAR